MTRLFLDRIDGHTKDIEILSERIDGLMKPFLPARVPAGEYPGLQSQTVAEVFIAESGSRSALLRSGPLRTVRAPHRRTRLKQAARALRVAVLASCVCGLGARGGRRCHQAGAVLVRPTVLVMVDEEVGGDRPAGHAQPPAFPFPRGLGRLVGGDGAYRQSGQRPACLVSRRRL